MFQHKISSFLAKQLNSPVGKRLATSLAASLLCMLLPACQSSSQAVKPPATSVSSTVNAQAAAPVVDEGYWNKPEGLKGSPKIMISLEDQVAYFYIGKTLVGESPISSGKSSTRTPTGRYSVIQKKVDHRSSAYGVFKSRATGEIVDNDAEVNKEPTPKGCYFVGAKMPYFMRITGGYGMHAGYLPGYAASHGCIRLPYSMAQKFYQNAPYGTPVIIRHDIN